eukprot:gene7463-13234_t
MSQSTSDGPSKQTRWTCKQGGRRGLEKPEQMPDIKQMIADALAPIRDDLAKIPSRETVDAMLADLIVKTEGKIEAKIQERVNELISRVETLEKRVVSLESFMVVLEHLHKKSDENEQYRKRSCLRIVNVPLPKQGGKEDCEKKVKQI